jgi:hypothetical protein
MKMYTVRSARLVLVTVGVSVALATAISVRADQSGAEAAMQACEDQLRDRYEEETTFHLVRGKRFADGVRLQVAARIDPDKSLFATCWVTREEIERYALRNGPGLVATRGSEVPPR